MRNCAIARFLVPAVVIAVVSTSVGQTSRRPTEPAEKPVVRIGAVAYSPNVVTVFNELCRYLNRNNLPSDYVLYSNYDALVAALERREIDIAWNTPLAHARYHSQNGSSQTLVMRDVDRNVRSVVVARADSGITSLSELAGKRLVLGSSDAAEATVLPIFYLEREGVEFARTTMIRLDKEVDFKGNPCCSPSHVLQAIRDRRGDAGIITESLWKQIEADEAKGGTLTKIWTSPPFSHCVFTAPIDFEEVRARQFIRLMTAMDAGTPECAEIMRLEGTKKWLPGTSEGFNDLVEAILKR